jgi:ectoine hydroxylase-related dioxygenase (phytanoyl-CoA dioxygenase family)
MKVIDDFLPVAYQNKLEKTLLGMDFPWYLNMTTVPVTDDATYNSNYNSKNTKEGFQFTHLFIRDGSVYSDFYPLVSVLTHHLMLKENIEIEKTMRIKANLTVQDLNYPVANHHSIHVDYELRNLITCIYYVNDSDGDTVFFSSDGKDEVSRVSPKKGRLVYFNGQTLHAGRPPVNKKHRCVINFNLLTEDCIK